VKKEDNLWSSMSTCTSPPLASLTSSVGILPDINSQIKHKKCMKKMYEKMYTSITKPQLFQKFLKIIRPHTERTD
jgi:hypothetical protein